MKYNDIKVGEEYAVGSRSTWASARGRVRVVEIGEFTGGLATITAARKAEREAQNEKSTMFGRVSFCEVVVDGVTYPAIGSRVGSRGRYGNLEKGALVVRLDDKGKPQMLEDGKTPRVVFEPSRRLLSTWVDHVEETRIAEERRVANGIAKREASLKAQARHAEIVKRVTALGITLTEYEVKHYGDPSQVLGMSFKDWDRVLAAVDVKIAEASK